MTTRRRSIDSVSVHQVAGYRILLQKTPMDTINVECAINAGFVTETKETAGANHILEHILTESWTKCGTTCSGYWSDKGVDMNASTDETVLLYHTRGTLNFMDQMIQYITSICTHPVLKMKSLKKEKEAVIDEMLKYGNDPECKLDQLFNEHFYTGGLVHKDSWKLHIDNLKHLSLARLQKIYEQNYNPRNLIFIVTGNFQPNHVLPIFERELLKRPLGPVHIPSSSCFTSQHGIYFSKEKSETTKIVLGFPSALTAHEPDAVLLNMLCGILNDLLFSKLRTELTLVYGVRVLYNMNICGTAMLGVIYVREKNVLKCLRAFFKTLTDFTKHLFPKQKLFAAKQRELYNYENNLPYTNDYLIQYVHQINEAKPLLYSKKEKLQILSKVTLKKLQSLFKKLYNVEKCLLAYQGKNDLNLQWGDIL